jgi:uncharacterized membrane protein YcaP (DUF421 family)
MKKEDIQPWDWQRILFGQAPPEFLLEVFLRTTLIYLALMLVTRGLGKRMGGQLSISELAVMVTLGAIVSPAMQIPQLGLLLGVMILICALLFQRGLGLTEFMSRKFEKVSQGTTQLLVKDGIIQIHELTRARISRQQLYAALRDENVYNLGDVGRVYIEAFGCFSVFKRKSAMPGLCILPPSDTRISFHSQLVIDGRYVCINCGTVAEETDKPDHCASCHASVFISASVTTESEKVAI